jgi:hypothetical protein
MGHSIKLICAIKTKESSADIAEKIVNILSVDHHIRWMNEGFKYEFNGLPVIERNTCKSYTNRVGIKCTYKEYCIMSLNHNGIVKLFDYSGFAGKELSGVIRQETIDIFKSYGNVREDNEDNEDNWVDYHMYVTHMKLH